MHCPVCLQAGSTSETRVVDTRQNEDGTAITRRRECKRDRRHKFPTTERWPIPGLAQTYVRRSSDGKISGLFSQARLRTDISDGILRRFSPEDLSSIVADVCSDLTDQLTTVSQPLTAAEMEELKPTFASGSISDFEIMTAVERRLRRESDRAAHVLYSLSFRGRAIAPSSKTDTDAGRHGFRDAEDFLRWFYSDTAYFDHREPLPERGMRNEFVWWPPRTPKQPESVIKRDGNRKKFGIEQYAKSIALAFLGRHQAKERAWTLAQYALFRLEGQPMVKTSQLASEAMSALRMMDDIAYLRYASIAKGFVSVRDFSSEARGLLEYPAPRLIFDRKKYLPAYPVNAFRSGTSPRHK